MYFLLLTRLRNRNATATVRTNCFYTSPIITDSSNRWNYLVAVALQCDCLVRNKAAMAERLSVIAAS